MKNAKFNMQSGQGTVLGLVHFASIILHLSSFIFVCGCTSRGSDIVATFSIVARDPATGELGVAVASKFIAVGAVVPYAKAGVGAVATQAWANTTYGPRGLEMMEQGIDPRVVTEELLRDDGQRAHRQVGLIDAQGRVHAYTGEKCLPFAGHLTGENYTIQGNILANEAVLEAMAQAFEQTKGDLADRLLAALAAGESAGGDKRGRQSAALLIVRQGWGYNGQNDRYRDLRVDDHERPAEELERIYDIHRRAFPVPK